MNTVPPPPLPAPAATPVDKGHAGVGVAITIVALVLVIPAVFIGVGLAELFDVRSDAQLIWALAPVMFPGALQYLWVAPLALYFQRLGKPNTANGMWITSGVILLLNGACYGALMLM